MRKVVLTASSIALLLSCVTSNATMPLLGTANLAVFVQQVKKVEKQHSTFQKKIESQQQNRKSHNHSLRGQS